MDKKEKRNLVGSILCFLSCCLFGGIALAFWMWREVYQSDWNHFEIEKDDIIRYSGIGALGYIVNVVLLLTLMK